MIRKSMIAVDDQKVSKDEEKEPFRAFEVIDFPFLELFSSSFS